ncbi:hypothetical protein G4G27_15335 [Sphingomonas sp. So64.6b]|uniref:hypothetical protein n=1 Tax=Sphingomonas sp. So64.6b TaxID=2997354 RepID=UPI0016029FCA|nr:hypothetical protein [Sphingomonas sp. So64.6b]QNA85218.1 hypothetical protein G4G27_15335 [Sphingomonas sp. So64.6b]
MTASRTPDIPPENGKRASIDSRTGEVHGSGMGAGGGSPGEDYDSDTATGDGQLPQPDPKTPDPNTRSGDEKEDRNVTGQ